MVKTYNSSAEHDKNLMLVYAVIIIETIQGFLFAENHESFLYVREQDAYLLLKDLYLNRNEVVWNSELLLCKEKIC